jgi:ribose transport system ATP-binding protein
MSFLSMCGISKAFPGVRALQNVDFHVEKGEVHCLIGANGAGKSTLMKILAGVYHPDQGEIHFQDKVIRFTSPADSKQHGIMTIFQELSLVEHLTVAENIFLGTYHQPTWGVLSWKKMYDAAQHLIDDLGIAIQAKQLVSELSMGHKQIVEIVKALANQAQIIVMDEPSTTLSNKEIQTLFAIIEKLKKQGVAVVYISHKLEELFAVGDRVTVLRDGKKVMTRPLRELDQEQLAEWITGEKRKKQALREENQSFSPLFRVEGLCNEKIQNISFSCGRGEVVGLYGLVGSGRTETLRAIFGADRLAAGEVIIHEQPLSIHSPHQAISQGIAFVPENRKTEGGVLDLSVEDNAILASLQRIAAWGVIQPQRVEAAVSEQMKALRVRTPSTKTLLGHLSGGNQQKVMIAKWLLRQSQILLFDEPTQGVDIGAKQEIYDIIHRLSTEGKAIIVASSELNELLEICHRVLVYFRGQVVAEFCQPRQEKDQILHFALTGGREIESPITST